MAFEGYDASIPRINIQMDGSKTVCIIDLETGKRFGHVFQNGKQGMHLFSAGYYLSSLAVHFNGRTLQDVAKEITTCFHINILTKLLINAQFKPSGRATVFNKDWEALYKQLVEAYQEFVKFLESCNETCKPKCYIDHPTSLQNYLNYVGALHHIFPCNVIYAENSTDPSGGGKSSAAIGNLANHYNNLNNYNDSSLKNNIKDILDAKVIEEIFRNGFDENNTWCLAFIIMQAHELRALRAFHSHGAYCWEKYINYSEMKDFVWEITNSFNQKHAKDSYEDEFKKAIEKIVEKRRIVLNAGFQSSRISGEIRNILR